MITADTSYAVSHLQSDYTTITVQFPRQQDKSKFYTYKARLSMGIKPGDHCVVISPNYGPTVVEVYEVHSYPQILPNIIYKWVVSRVDLTEYNAEVALEEEFAEVEAACYFQAKRDAIATAIKSTLGESPRMVDLLKRISGGAK